MLTPPISPIVPNPINPRNSVISQGPIAYSGSAQTSMLASTFPYLGEWVMLIITLIMFDHNAFIDALGPSCKSQSC